MAKTTATIPRRFWVWKEDTCWVCQNTRPNGIVSPSYHAREKLPESWEGHSPCTTVAREVYALNRAHAIRILQGRAEGLPKPIPWWQQQLQS